MRGLPCEPFASGASLSPPHSHSDALVVVAGRPRTRDVAEAYGFYMYLALVQLGPYRYHTDCQWVLDTFVWVSPGGFIEEGTFSSPS